MTVVDSAAMTVRVSYTLPLRSGKSKAFAKKRGIWVNVTVLVSLTPFSTGGQGAELSKVCVPHCADRKMKAWQEKRLSQ